MGVGWLNPARVPPPAGILTQPLLELRDARITFGDTHALQGVSLKLDAGSVHGLVGQNGSGKSSIVKILTGIYRPEQTTKLLAAGEILHLPVSTAHLAAARIGVVHQDIGIAPSLSIVDNVLARHYPTSGLWRIEKRTGRDMAHRILGRLGLNVDVTKLASILTEAEKSILAFARALYEIERSGGTGPGVLILDEVTARLGPSDSEAVVSTIHRLRDDGWGILFVGHRLDEVVELCDVVTVIRDGSVAGKLVGAQVTTDGLVSLAMGDLPDLGSTPPPAVGEKDKRATFAARVDAGPLQDTRFDGNVGEVLGITGLAGSGVDTLPYALVGHIPLRAGELRVGDDQYDLQDMTPGKALQHGIGLIPGDRLINGVAGVLTVQENLAITELTNIRGPRLLSRVNLRKLEAVTKERIGKYSITPSNPGRKVANLSGGNQQKILVARILEQNPQMLIAHEPTAGVDVGARAEIFHLIRESARNGCATIVCSQDVDEVWDASDRVLVLSHGRIIAELDTAVDDQSLCTRAILSSGSESNARQ